MSGKLFTCVGLAGLLGLTAVGATCTWTGAAGDGLWATPGNWQNNAVPTSSDTVVIPANTADAMDAGDAVRTLAGLTFTQPVGSFTLKGAGLRVANNVTLKMFGGKSVTIDCPFALTGANRTLTIGSSTNSVLIFKQPVSASTISATTYTGTSDGYAHNAKVRFAAPMDYTTLELKYNNIVCDAANVLSPTGVVSFTGTGWGEIHHGVSVDLNGHDQTVLGIKAQESSQYPRYNTSENWQSRARNVKSTGRAATLTIRSASDYTSSCRFADNLSIVFAPTSAGAVQSFIKRPNTMNGYLAISNGTFRIAEEATFKNVQYLCIYPGATLEVTADSFRAATNALAGLVEMYVAPGATLDLPTGTDATLPVTTTDGVHYYRTIPSGVTQWRGTTGSWSSAANWSLGVPSPNLAAEIASLGEPVRVSIDADAASATNVALRAHAHQPAELEVAAKLPLDQGFVDVGRNARLVVKSGGRLETTGPMFDHPSENSVARLQVQDNGELIVEDGGSVAVSNAYGTVRVGTSDGKRARLEVQEGGDFSFFPSQTGTVFRVYAGGELDVKGRLAVYRRFKSSRKGVFNMSGGRIDLSGKGMLEFPNDEGPYAGNGGQFTFTFDAITAVDDSALAMGLSSSWDTDVNFAPQVSGAESVLRLADNACFSNAWGHLALKSKANSRTIYDLSGSTRGFYRPDGDFCMDLTIGGNGGYTLFDYAGANVTIGTFGFNLGHYNGSGAVVETNLVNVHSAVVTCNATTSVNPSSGGISYPYSRHYGALIGVHTKNSVDLTKDQRGPVSRLNLCDEDAGFVVRYGHFLVGVGRAEGRFVQLDGKTEIAKPVNWGSHDRNTNQVTVVGAWGGVGELVVSNGTYTTWHRTFVGGVATNDYLWGHNMNGAASLHLGYHDAEGLVRIAGGTFTANKDVFVGKDGSGTVEIGSCGALVGETLHLLGPTATLAFSLDGTNGFREGESSVKKLVVAAGASLTVDLGDYHGRSKTLLAFETKEGNFLPENVALTGTYSRDYVVDVKNDRIRLRSNTGTLLLFR